MVDEGALDIRKTNNTHKKKSHKIEKLTPRKVFKIESCKFKKLRGETKTAGHCEIVTEQTITNDNTVK